MEFIFHSNYNTTGTSTSKEAKEYFSDMVRHRIKFKYGGVEDDNAVDMAFSKKKIEERKVRGRRGCSEAQISLSLG